MCCIFYKLLQYKYVEINDNNMTTSVSVLCEKGKIKTKLSFCTFQLLLAALSSPAGLIQPIITGFLMTRLIRYFSRWTKLWGASEQKLLTCLCKNKHKCPEQLATIPGPDPENDFQCLRMALS